MSRSHLCSFVAYRAHDTELSLSPQRLLLVQPANDVAQEYVFGGCCGRWAVRVGPELLCEQFRGRHRDCAAALGSRFRNEILRRFELRTRQLWDGKLCRGAHTGDERVPRVWCECLCCSVARPDVGDDADDTRACNNTARDIIIRIDAFEVVSSLCFVCVARI